MILIYNICVICITAIAFINVVKVKFKLTRLQYWSLSNLIPFWLIFLVLNIDIPLNELDKWWLVFICIMFMSLLGIKTLKFRLCDDTVTAEEEKLIKEKIITLWCVFIFSLIFIPMAFLVINGYLE